MGADGTAFVVESAPGTAASATGTDAIAVGDTAVASGTDAIAIGQNADATGANCIAIGGHVTDASSANCTSGDSISIGVSSDATSSTSIAIGASAQATTSTSTMAIGNSSTSTGSASIAIGRLSIASATDSIGIGNNVDATGLNSIAIGGDAVDANSANATADDTIALGQVATASTDSAIAIGRSSIASGSRSLAIGRETDATGDNCIAIGGNATDTDSADCSAADSVALGQHILADDIGEFAFASGEFAAQSDAHTSIYVLRRNTTDDTQGELFSDGLAGDIGIASDCAATFRASVVARQTDADNVSAGYFLRGVIDNNAGTTALVGLATTDTLSEDVAAWDVIATADDANDGLNILVTGAINDDVNWVARVEIAYVCG